MLKSNFVFVALQLFVLLDTNLLISLHFVYKMAKLFLLLGGNLGDKAQIFSTARRRLEEELGAIIERSSVYETEPWGFDCEDLFWNQVVVIETKLTPVEVLKFTKSIELELGRIRKAARYTSRLIDIDLLFYDDLVFHEPDLELPHPRMIDRRFVLEPLAEVAADFIHPVFKQSIVGLLEECSDQLAVKRLID